MFLRFLCVTSICVFSLVRLIAAEPNEKIGYNRDVRPILADNCFACHGSDSGTREADLRIDQRDAAIEAGAIVAGSPDESELIARINLDADDESLMPPTGSHHKLTQAQKETLAKWVAEGALYEPHWSFIAPVASEPPSVKQTGWVRNSIDQFVLARLESEGLSPAPQADRRTLARRAALDVTGLPPEPQWVEAFVADTDPNAYDKYLDRLFSQSTWGEHRGRYWLDYARYADTHGIHFDNYREIWAYRDWVISAFNQNMPFDQFSIEQLAGDLLENPTLDQQIATGFHRCNMTTNEGGIIDDEYAVLYARDRTETTAAVWMGLTAGCAVCHDHKFDPVSMKDFYSLSAFFNNTTQAVRDGNISNTPPIIPVPLLADRTRFNELPALIAESDAKIVALEAAGVEQLKTATPSVREIADSLPRNESLVFHAPLGEGSGDTTNVMIEGRLVPLSSRGALAWGDGQTQPRALVAANGVFLGAPGVGDFDIRDPFTVAAWVYPEKPNIGGSIIGKIEAAEGLRGWDLWMEGGKLAVHFVSKWPQTATKIVASNALPVNEWSHVALVNDGSGTLDSLRLFVNGKEQTDRKIANDTLVAAKDNPSIRSSSPLMIGSREKDSAADKLRINDVRIYSASLKPREVNNIGEASLAMYTASLPMDRVDEARAKMLARWMLSIRSVEYRGAVAARAKLSAEEAAIRIRGTIAHVMSEKPTPATAHMLNRGEYDQRLDEVAADVPAQLPPLGDLPHNRLGLARWLFSDTHPLTSRVSVNRFWQEVFGTGLVRTSADFGVMGEPPSHPELLDHLAVQFRESGWDVQSLFRTMLTSATYQQSSRHSDAAIHSDPANRLLSHGPRFRMHAEMVRDLSLWASGLLSPTIGGPSVRPYQPPGVWEAVAMPESNTRNYKEDTGEGLYRRSMYTFWKRAAPPASMEILGAPSREVCTIQRESTNTPLQALVTLNDPQFVEASRKLAAMTLSEPSLDDPARLQFIGQRLLSRSFNDAELKILASGLDKLRNHYRANQEDAAALLAVGQSQKLDSLPAEELAAWTMLANELLNLDEALCK